MSKYDISEEEESVLAEFEDNMSNYETFAVENLPKQECKQAFMCLISGESHEECVFEDITDDGADIELDDLYKLAFTAKLIHKRKYEEEADGEDSDDDGDGSNDDEDSEADDDDETDN
jgi:hypothetical protein